MSAKPFLFTIELPPGASAAMLRDLVARVCAAASCSPASTAELTPQVEAAIAQAPGNGHCELRFEAHDHTLDVSVRAGAVAVWQVSRPID